ncbi:MAG: hypothetical protein A3F54_05560 [Candidatus Kerfeldbacteria bacterium RIFCSPHIGHO2_12_FULL_48_17]|uniref:Uncharacterized protein n=1 Tax=Candidatus Kerfeldbacteria bacterium RIFCSPHIGHO2_12_FULL_48_17 TaxID=1798542 RepID=A0A1G2B5R1_9BACT|nr:MAG: hypothetical protein A3F54_05560 [Candidatus Kerfeldbacteria bacterium RIFCSPHIGHO2_12_FULL_48_17]
MNESQDLVTKKYLQESFKDFGETLMKIFVTKDELKETRQELKKEIRANKKDVNIVKADLNIVKLEIQEMRQENRSAKDEILRSNAKLLKSNDNITKLILRGEAERAATTHRMDRIESDFGPRITVLEEAHKQCN